MVGKNEFEKGQIDAYIDQITDLSQKVIEYLSESDPVKLAKVKENMSNSILPTNFKFFEDKIKEGKSGFLIGDNLTWADLVN